MSAALLAPHDPEPYHGGDALHAPEWCQKRLVATCADCRREIVCCTVSRPEITAMLAVAWLCPDCRTTVAVDPPVSLSPADEDGAAAAAAGIACLAALFAIVLLALAGFLYLMHMAGTGRLPW
jgi:hypothetical protein